MQFTKVRAYGVAGGMDRIGHITAYINASDCVTVESVQSLVEAAPQMLAVLERVISCHWLSIDYDHNRTPEACEVRRLVIDAIAAAKAATNGA